VQQGPFSHVCSHIYYWTYADSSVTIIKNTYHSILFFIMILYSSDSSKFGVVSEENNGPSSIIHPLPYVKHFYCSYGED